MRQDLLRRARRTLPSFVAIGSLTVALLAPIFIATRADAAAAYTWLGQPPNAAIQRVSDGAVFTQITNDDAGQKLDLAGDQIVLESLRDNQSCKSGLTNYPFDNTQTSIITVNNGMADAQGGNGELLIVQPYLSATSAKLITFQHVACTTTGALNGAVTQANNPVNVSLNAGGATWTSSTTIAYLNNTFTQTGGVSNGTMTLSGPNAAPNGRPCSPQVITIGDSNNSYLTATTATLTINSVQGTGQGTCVKTTSTVQMSNKFIDNGGGTTAHWVDGSNTDPGAEIQIDNVGGGFVGAGIAVSSVISTGDIYLEPSNGALSNGNADMTLNHQMNCHGTEDAMLVKGFKTAQSGTIRVYHNNGHACLGPFTIQVGFTNMYGGAPITGNPTPTQPTNNSNGCIIPGNNGLNWVMCPLFTLLSGAVSLLNNMITTLLIFPVNTYFDSSNGLQQAYSVFRNISVGMLVLAGLLMVISQAADLEIFAAHTVRKALPRIIIAAILIALSWPLLRFTITFFNDLGQWVGQIIITVATSYKAAQQGFDGLTFLSQIGTMAIGGLIVGVAVLIMGAAAVLSFLVSIVLVFLMGFIVLALRQVIILICILGTPIAIASFVLPGTEKVGRFWKDTFIAVMVMFPIITAFLSAGAAMAYITMNAKSGDYTYHILAVIFFIGPYFVLPFAFRLAGGLVEQIVNFAEGAHKQGAGGLLQNYRKGEREWRHQQRMEGRQGFGIFGQRGASLYRRALTRGGIAIPTRANRERYRAFERKRLGQVGENIIAREDAGYGANDDTANEIAARRGMTRSRFVEEYNRATRDRTTGALGTGGAAALGMLEASYQAQIGSGAMRIAAFKAATRSGTSYRSSDAGWYKPAPGAEAASLADGQRRMYADAGSMVEDGLMSTDEAVSAIKFNPNAATRKERTGAGYGDVRAAVVDATAGRAVDINRLQQAAIYGNGPGDLLGARPEALHALAPQMTSKVATSIQEYNDAQTRLTAAPNDRALQQTMLEKQEKMDENLAQVDSLYNYLKSTSPEKADIIARQVMGKVITPRGGVEDGVTAGIPLPGAVLQSNGTYDNSGAKTLRQYIETARLRPADKYGQQTFIDRSREYGSAMANAQAAATQNAQNPGGPGGPGNSDRRIKTNIRYLSTLDNGIRLYRFTYKWGGPELVGVIAQEIIQTHPEAVSTGTDGYYRVDYRQLGITMMTYADWLEQTFLAQSKTR